MLDKTATWGDASEKGASSKASNHVHYKKYVSIISLLIAALLGVIIVACSLGPVSIPFRQTVIIFLEFFHVQTIGTFSQRDYTVVTDIRLPRVMVGVMVGAALGISGAIMQGLFRNPLVEPGYIGVSSGAAVGAVLVIFFGWTQLSKWLLPASAFIGAWAAILIILFIWKASKKNAISTLLLIGLGMNLFLSAVISVFVASAPSEQELRSIVFWLQGGLEARTWQHVQLISPFILGSILLVVLFSRELNMMLLGDEQAQSSGVNVRLTRYILLGAAALMIGVGVAVSGTIGFVGLIIPHVIRLLAGPDHRLLLPASALGGAIFLVLADIVSRMMLNPVSLQVGVVCALIGAPVFLLLTVKSRRGSM